MSSRSEVSKMLAGRSSRPGSAVGRSIGASGTFAQLAARRAAAAVVNGGSATANGVGAASANGAAGSASGSGSAAGSSTAAKSRVGNVGFLLMKCQEVLKKAEQPLHLTELQALVERNISGDAEFLKILKENPRINFDPVKKRWSYRSPYEHLTSPDAMVRALSERTEHTYGLEITPELLNHHPNMEQWLLGLLKERRVRAVRVGKTTRCKQYSAESGIVCDLYDSERCESCMPLRGVVIYALGGDHIELPKVDEDIKDLWEQIPIAPLDDILQQYDRGHKRQIKEDSDNRRRRKKPAPSRAPRITKITNTHVYTAEEYKEALREVGDQ